MLEELLQSGEISLEEGKWSCKFYENYEAMKHKTCDLIIVRKLGISTCLLVSNVDDLIFEKGTKIVLREAIMKYTEALKLNCCSGGESMRTDNLIINGYGSSNGGEFHKVQLKRKRNCEWKC